mmetsp:Transcript_14709/g.22991  ORF Transcript_14709/g.22991 Transcript_14709/m.22991 type:complete len:569 (+) Transcript_14709:154-1860(+)
MKLLLWMMLSFLVAWVTFLQKVSALDNGLALTPPMGISTWSVFRGNVNHSLILELTDSIVRLGLHHVGYEYVLVDAGWTTNKKNCKMCLPNRDSNGNLVIDERKFPNLTETIDYVHSKGIKFGLWFGVEMCATTNDESEGSPAKRTNSSSSSRSMLRKQNAKVVDYATLDAQLFASLRVDAIKHDSCGIEVTNTSKALRANFAKYEAMSRALNQTGRPILYDVTLQVDKPIRTLPAYDYKYIWSPEPYGQANVQRIANMWWSVPVNKYNCWSCCVHPNEYIVPKEYCNSPHHVAAWRGLLPMIDIQDMGIPGWMGHWDWAGRGKGWNHLDQLGICIGPSWYGPGLSPVEQYTQVSLWAILASPMIISVDVRNMTSTKAQVDFGNQDAVHHGDDFCYHLIANEQLIAVHQDPLGLPGRRLKNNYNHYHNDGNDYGGMGRPPAAAQENGEKTIETQLWGRPLKDGSVAVVFFNRAETERTISATFEEIGLSSSLSLSSKEKQSQLKTTVRTTNVWTGISNGGISSPLIARSVPPHGVIFLIVTPEKEAEPRQGNIPIFNSTTTNTFSTSQ